MQLQTMLPSHAPDPDLAEQRYTQLAASVGALSALRTAPQALQVGVIRVLGYSNFLSHYLLSRPEQLCTLLVEPGFEAVERCSDAVALRHYKYRELFRITCRDLGGAWDCQQVLSALSVLAETVLQRAMELAAQHHPVTANPCVLALGKLGGGELNFSSDVDLVFLCGELDATELSAAVAQLQAYTRMLDAREPEGFLYRVDLRLRPWGEAGPLLLSVDATENYFSGDSQGWERFAWMRMRPIAGEVELGMALKQRMQSFLYPRSLDVEELREWVSIKQKMHKHRERPSHWDVKAGEGGIRDVEFFVQILQLLHGARQLKLRTPSTLGALANFPKLGLLSFAETGRVRAAYLYLRALENRLQMVDERQTHHLPANEAVRLKLARAMGEPDMAKFEAQLEEHRKVAQSCFERVLPNSTEKLDLDSE